MTERPIIGIAGEVGISARAMLELAADAGGAVVVFGYSASDDLQTRLRDLGEELVLRAVAYAEDIFIKDPPPDFLVRQRYFRGAIVRKLTYRLTVRFNRRFHPQKDRRVNKTKSYIKWLRRKNEC